MREHLRHDTRNTKVDTVPFSLTEKARQWYTYAVESTNGDWDELKGKFHLASSLCPVSTLYQGQSLTLSSARSL
jgi:hypothetical protein